MRSLKLPFATARTVILLAFTLTQSACSHNAVPETSPGPGMYALLVNGQPMNVPIVSTVFEALIRTSSASFLGELSSPTKRPLYVLDGIGLLDGLQRLKATPVCHVEAVGLLRPIQAVALYGEKANAGAVVIRSRRGSTANTSC